MNTVDLDRLISHYMKRFDGVFSSDRLPLNPRMLLSNTHPYDKPREHWVAIYVSDDEDYREYFDSFGRPPTDHFDSYMNKHCSRWTYNRNQLESLASNFCNLYCACYCILRSRNVDMTRFVYFTNDTGLNDLLEHELMCRLLNCVIFRIN